MTDDEKQAAIDAKRFLEDPTTPRVLDKVVKHYRDALEKSAHDEVALRESCYVQLKAVREFLRQLTILADKGTLSCVRQNRGGSNSAR